MNVFFGIVFFDFPPQSCGIKTSRKNRTVRVTSHLQFVYICLYGSTLRLFQPENRSYF
nr:MAG TPA: hypothetical protein [Caudoviricetes sp.]DAV08706.1 MAG TPA: hypothetical protein [Caudoviricetes sp.]